MITRDKYNGCDTRIKEALLADKEILTNKGWVKNYSDGYYYVSTVLGFNNIKIIEEDE